MKRSLFPNSLWTISLSFYVKYFLANMDIFCYSLLTEVILAMQQLQKECLGFSFQYMAHES